MIISHEELAIRCLCQFGASAFLSSGITGIHFRDPVYREMYEWGVERLKDGKGLSPQGMEARFESYRHEEVSEEDVSVAIDLLIDKKLRRSLAIEVDKHVTLSQERGNIVPVIESLGQALRDMLDQTGSPSLVDAFSKEGAGGRCLEELKSRQEGKNFGIPTGLDRLDFVTGGLQRRELVSIIGRTGRGKSWVGIKMIQAALNAGCKVLYYPLEMNLTAVMYRLHTFLAKDFGFKNMRNRDLSRDVAKVDVNEYKELLKKCHKKFEGQLRILDIGSVKDGYTVDRVYNDCERERPDMVVVDYLTLLQLDGTFNVRTEDYVVVRQLSNGLKLISVNYDLCSIVVAQVNRAGEGHASGSDLLPKLKHISFGDALGADSDKVISINKLEETMYYGLIKNRSGEEFGRTKIDFRVNEGILDEIKEGESRGRRSGGDEGKSLDDMFDDCESEDDQEEEEFWAKED